MFLCMEINISLHGRKYFFTRRKFGTDARMACREQVPTTVSGYVKADGQATGKTAGKGRQGGAVMRFIGFYFAVHTLCTTFAVQRNI